MLKEFWLNLIPLLLFLLSFPAWLLVLRHWRTKISVTRSWSSSSRTTATSLKPTQSKKAAQKNSQPLSFSRSVFTYKHQMPMFIWNRSVLVVSAVVQLVWQHVVPMHFKQYEFLLSGLWPQPLSIHLEEWWFINTDLYNVKLKLIHILIFYHSLAVTTPPQVAVLSLWLIYICCLDVFIDELVCLVCWFSWQHLVAASVASLRKYSKKQTILHPLYNFRFSFIMLHFIKYIKNSVSELSQ